MGEPSDRAPSRPKFTCSPSDLVQAPQQDESGRPVIKVAEYIPKVPGEPKRTLWRLNDPKFGKYKAASISPLNPDVDSFDSPSDLVQDPLPEECRPVVKVAEYMPKVAGEPKRTLWRRNSPNMRKRGLKAPSIGPLNSGVDSYSSDLVQAPLPEWRPLVKVAEYMPKLYEGNRDGSYKTGEPSEGASSGPADVESGPAEEPEPVDEFTASSSSEEEQDDRCNTRKKRRQSPYSYNMCKYRGHSWPQVKGLKVHKAERIIKKGKPNLWCEVIQENQLMTMCYCPTRVRIIVDSHNNVMRTPDVG